MKKAVIVGIFGQDGQFLCNNLEKDGYVVTGIGRNKVYSSDGKWNKLIDITNKNDVIYLIKNYKPDEVYYLAAHHHSSEDNIESAPKLINESYKINVFSYINFLESIKNYSLNTKIFYAASSHIFGKTKEPIQDENTEFSPNSIYGITKLDGLLLSRYYRKIYSIFSSVGIMYNHESHLRSSKFASKKIVKSAVEIKNGVRDKLQLGDLHAHIDWGYAGDFVDAMKRIIIHNIPNDYIIATGHSVKLINFVDAVFKELNLNFEKFVVEDRSLLKRKSTTTYCGNFKKLFKATGWKPSTDVNLISKHMVKKELDDIHL
jgi:GDPmannose 4,6-dehydratase